MAGEFTSNRRGAENAEANDLRRMFLIISLSVLCVSAVHLS
jgi:hypothetical protein